MAIPTTPPLEREQAPLQPRVTSQFLLSALVVVALPLVLYLLGAIFGGTVGDELRQIGFAAIEAIPFMILAVFSYLGINRLWGKVAALAVLALLVGGGAVLLALIGAVTLLDMSNQSRPVLGPGNGLKLGVLLLGMPVMVLIAALGFIPAVRRWLSRFIPLDPNSFVHMTMLVVVVGVTLIDFYTLVVLGEPILLTLVNRATASGTAVTSGRDDSGQLRDTLYGLVWLVPATIFAVGFGIARDLRGALARLGLVRPTLRQVAAALGIAVLLVIGVQFLSAGISWLWDALGWPKTDDKAFGELLGFAMSPLGALVVGVTAGLGEELAVRGVLQPRAGILLSNLFFASLHALQYNWDSLLVVFVVGLVLGVVRKRTNTSTSAIVHGTYDFLLILASVLHVPWFGS